MLLEARGERFSRTRFAEKYPIANEYAYPMRGIARKKELHGSACFKTNPARAATGSSETGQARKDISMPSVRETRACKATSEPSW